MAEKRITLELAIDELRIVNSCLNEVCNGIDIEDFEFDTRLGVSREEVSTLLQKIHELLRQSSSE